MVVENCEGQEGVWTGGINPVICIIVGDGFCGGVWGVGGNWEWGISKNMCHMSGGGLENQGGLGLPKKHEVKW